ncbi:MAG: aminotransferase class V-fold PLP-dependent enzyme [Bacteroidota bacterium]
MISFYPGPSRVYDAIPKYVKSAHRKGVMSMNHRSDEFVSICEKTVALLKEKLSIPEDYKVYFLTSATECWEVIAQSLIINESHHIYNGAFGEKWFDYTRKLIPAAKNHLFDREKIPEPSTYGGDLICITQNETSNGTQVANEIISAIHSRNPDHILAIDATSSMAGISLNFSAADVWFASVQKCFGLPAGLSIIVCSPKAIARMKSKGEKDHYNSMTLLDSMMDKWQTPCTPNVLGIYMLMRVMKDVEHIREVEKKLQDRIRQWAKFLERSKSIHHLVKNEEVRSSTVLALAVKGDLDMQKLKTKARQAGFLLGEGYGDLKKDTFRIANFPAIRPKEIQKLMQFLSRHS